VDYSMTWTGRASSAITRSPRTVFWRHHLAGQLRIPAVNGQLGFQLSDPLSHCAQLEAVAAGPAGERGGLDP
jgi:hypothetical protein